MGEHLIVVPTPFEQSRWHELVGASLGRVEVVGFGPVASAARTSQWILSGDIRAVTLIGLAGTYDVDRLPIGEARCFDQVRLAEIGAGRERQQLRLDEIGFAQLELEDERIYDRLDLHPTCPTATTLSRELTLLTVLSASGDLAHANDRQAQHPEAIAEDMESFGVAIACACTRTPLSVIRGISNVAGDRNHVGWRVDDALIAASEVLREQP